MQDRNLVPGYRHVPGNHCGSTALRNMLAFHGLDMSEEMAFGLGAGACFFYVPLPGESPSRFINGRAARLEENFVELTGVPFELLTAADGEESWQQAKAVVDSGRPALLLTDLYYLDHYGKSAHFPGHAVVLAGYDDEQSYLSDTAFDDLQMTRLENLALARHSKHPAFPLDGHMFHVPEGVTIGDLHSAIPRAIERAAAQMLAPELGEFQGLPALGRFAKEAPNWPEEIDDWQWCSRFTYQVIERRGTGGGNFRRMYARFLEEAERDEASLAGEAADRWTGLAMAFHAASEESEPRDELWSAIGEGCAAVLDAEERLWQTLGAGSG
jgi:butirosin biosynthesis protein H-like/uncharacterized protein DUF4872